MKKLSVILILNFIIILAACKEDAKNNEVKPNNTSEISQRTKQEEVSKNSKTNNTNLEEDNRVVVEENMDFSGKYKRFDDGKETQNTCDCNCLEIDFDKPVELCIDKKSDLSIKVKFKQNSNDIIQMFYVSGSGETEALKNIPWGKFDKNTTLAEIKYLNQNAIELDWKGFTENKKLAMDYAILGKKNLEGKFKKIK